MRYLGAEGTGAFGGAGTVSDLARGRARKSGLALGNGRARPIAHIMSLHHVRSMPAHFDHFLIGTPHLDRTVAEFSRLHGVAPAFGGSHRAHGTSNYMLSLGHRCYVEFLGPSETKPDDQLNPIVSALPGERLIGLAFETSDLEVTTRRAKDLGLSLGPTQEDSRETPHGQRLSWRLALLDPSVFPGLLIFAIEWGDASHPSFSAPSVELAELEITAPDPAAHKYVHDLMGSDAAVQPGNAARLQLKISSPAGTVEYASDAAPIFERT